MSISFAPVHVPKLSRGWISVLTAGFNSGTLSGTTRGLASDASVDFSQLLGVFVEPDGQFLLDAEDGNAPAGQNFALGNRFSLLPYLVAFANNRADEPRYLCVVAPQGGGKTSLLVMLALAKLTNVQAKSPSFRYLKLGADTIDHILAIPEQLNTVLLLDSLDEDPLSFGRSAERLHELISATVGFRRVVVASTLSSIKLASHDRGGVNYASVGDYRIPVVAIAPFDQAHITKYLSRRLNQSDQRHDLIVAKLSHLGSSVSRPLFLDFLDELLEAKVDHPNAYDVLERLVEARLSAAFVEYGRAGAASQRLLTAAYTLVATAPDRPRRGMGHPLTVPDTVLDDSMRDALVGSGILRVFDSQVRFAHHAFVALFLAKALIEGTTHFAIAGLRPSNDVMALLRAWLSWPSGGVARDRLRWSQLNLANADMVEWDLARTNLKDAVLASADLTRADLTGADLRNADLSRLLATGANFTDTDCDGADFSGAHLSETSFSGAILTRTRLASANLRNAVLVRVSLLGADLRGTDLSHVTFREVRYDASTHWPSGFTPPARLP